MRVSHLSLVDFRNYESAELALEPGPNLILGRNGQGKTNLAEAISYFSSLRSHRVSSDDPLIRVGTDRATARMRVEANERSVVLEININRSKQNRATVNRNASKPRELTRWFSSIAFVPEDLGVVRGDPALRRRFLDDALAMRYPSAGSTLRAYERVVRQRTALLKASRGGQIDESSLAVWDDQLVSLGSQIIQARRELVHDLSFPLKRRYADLVGEDHLPELSLSESVSSDVDVSRETGIDHKPVASVSRETIEHSFRQKLASVRPQERLRGLTLIGPHRDDLVLSLRGLPVKGFASHGESWSFVLALKVALATILRDESIAGDPILILDDVFAELDAGRRERLLAAVSGFEQVIITAAVEEDIPGAGEWHKVRISSGQVIAGGYGQAD